MVARAARAKVATEGQVATSDATPVVESWKVLVVVMACQPQHRTSAAIAAGSQRPGQESAIPSWAAPWGWHEPFA